MSARYHVLVNWDDGCTRFVEAKGSPYATMKEAKASFDERVAAGEYNVRMVRRSAVILHEHVANE